MSPIKFTSKFAIIRQSGHTVAQPIIPARSFVSSLPAKAGLALCLLSACILATPAFASLDLTGTKWAWSTTPPLPLPVIVREGVTHIAYKDPSVVYTKGKWQVYASRVRYENGKTRYALAYLGISSWENASKADVRYLFEDADVACAPHVFFYRPLKKWVLIVVYKNSATGYKGPAYSFLDDIDRPETATPLVPCYSSKPASLPAGWLDYSVIADDQAAYMFFTDNKGRFFRAHTALGDFPVGWSEPELLLKETNKTVFEASQTYALPDHRGYITMIEGIGPAGSRWFGTYSAKTLDGAWTSTGTTYEVPFAGINNVDKSWSHHISHGELTRAGVDERMELDPDNLQLLYQGWDNESRIPEVPLRGPKGYHEIPWRLAVLSKATPKSAAKPGQ